MARGTARRRRHLSPPNEKEISHGRVGGNIVRVHSIRVVGFIDWLGLAMEQRGNVESEDYLPNKEHDSHYRMRANAP
jgi:hypothetical protein